MEGLAQLTGLDVASPDLEEARAKLATAVGSDDREKVLELARAFVARRMHMERVEAAFSAALAEGRAMPSQRQSFHKCPDPEVAITVIKALKPVAVLRNPLAPEGVDAERLDLDRRVRALAVQDGVSYAVALDRVMAEI